MLQHPFILTLGTIAHIVIFIAITLHCLQRRRNASATLLWIFIAWSFPILGPLLYVGFGVDRVSDRGYLKLLANEQFVKHRRGTRRSMPDAYWHDLRSAPAADAFQREMNRSLDALLPDHPALAGNAIRPLVNGDEAYPRMLAAIRGAEHHIHLQSFIIGHDAVAREFMDALAERAAAGVQVRLLFDRFGSTRAFLGGLFRRFRSTPNFYMAGWTQANPLKRQFQINLRNHRKCLVVDGRIGFFGGINLAESNCSVPGRPAIRDYHFEAAGPVVHELQFAFLRDWFFMTGESPDRLLTAACFPPIEPAGDVIARMICTGPSNEKEVAVETVFNSIVLAEKQVLAVTPYFVPPPDILRALRSAALRGIDVRLIVPQKNNHIYAGFAGRALYADLLEAGVRIVERRPPFMHAKALVVDGRFALVGTANLDIRSLQLNYETMVAAYSPPLADALKTLIHEEIAAGDELGLADWNRRPRTQRLMENFATLLSPVL